VQTLGDLSCQLPAAGQYVTSGTGAVIVGTAVASYGKGAASQQGLVLDNQLDYTSSNFLNSAEVSKYNFDYYDNKIRAYSSGLTIAGSSYSAAQFNTFLATVPVAADGFKYISAGNITFSQDISLGNNKVLLLSSGNVDLQGVTFNNGVGHMVVVAKGDINVGTNVGSLSFTTTPNLQGVFVANTFNTGSFSNRYLSIEGAVVAYDKVNFQRTVGVGVAPAEYFGYSLDMVMRLPKVMLRSGVVWQEIAP
jgi:hypothetical protein